jgi:allantoicase
VVAFADLVDLADLASERLGGSVLFANDDFFAPKENLLKPEPAVFAPDRYTDRGKWMDGWESRRRRTPGNDFCVVKLGFGGRLRGVDVDTSHFTGNFPEAFALDVAVAPDGLPPGAFEAAGAPWVAAIPRTPLSGNAHNLVPIAGAPRATHVRLHIHPDGGVARLRVYGDVEPDARRLVAGADLAALAAGGLVVATSDSFFSPPLNLLMPGPSTGMHDGWETKRSRRPAGFDWVVVRLGARGRIARAVVDTSHFRGNFPDRASLDVADAPLATRRELVEPGFPWRPLLEEQKLAADTEHVFESQLLEHGPGTHVRLKIHPDGGVARLRLFGRPAPSAFLRRLNAASPGEALSILASLCGGRRFSSKVEEGRPFATEVSLVASVSDTFEEFFSSSDWLEAFAAHPRLGDRAADSRESAEQAAALAAPAGVLAELASLNVEYEKRFGHIFIACASGQPAAALVAGLKARLGNAPDAELAIAAEEQKKITRLRLAKLLAEEAG